MDRDYFERIYADATDPWGFATSAYERRKYDLTLAALPRQHYRRGLEPGCSVGVLTADLAKRCDAVEAWEPIAAPRHVATQRTPDTVVVRDAVLGAAKPLPGPALDLVVLSEVVYYLPRADINAALTGILAHAADGADVVAVHWRHPIADMELTGDDAHDLIGAVPGMVHLGGWCEADFRIDTWRWR